MKTAFVQHMSALLDSLPQRMHAISETDFNTPLAPGKWSRKLILGHLIDSALNNTQRFVRGQHEENPKIVYMQDAWVEAQGYAATPAAELIVQWEQINRRILAIVQHMPDAHLSRSCDTGSDTPAPHTLDWLIDDYLLHMRHHLAQITNDEPVPYP